ncbi:uncharacterized protein LOC128863920 [Anastrepha ludens]|uniref:uncharacterized protein LOC128863920 n=1 Tax=Anastrepha ludens TaxID=28586 RepID=UPI0023AEB251|nr:uncharacterized protein LOC128863920 [Anastrepha ludens]
MPKFLNQTTANISYHHKKFGGCKRFQDEEARKDLKQVNDQRSPGAVSSISQLSSDDSEYAEFAKLFSASSSTPYKKTRNPSEDSGISVTSQRQQLHETPLLRRTKRKLKLSSLAESPSEQQSIEKQQPASISPTINNKQKPRTTATAASINRANKRANTGTTRRNIRFKAQAIKALIKSTAGSALQLPTGSKSATDTTASSLPDIDTSLLSLINENKLRSICAYHGNMVRSFPKKERSPKDQERRDKNTIACRLSRRVRKLQQLAIGEHYKQIKEIYDQMVEVMVRGNEYLKYLNKDVLGAADGSCNAEVVLPAQPEQRAPSRFSIADILGVPNEDNNQE